MTAGSGGDERPAEDPPPEREPSAEAEPTGGDEPTTVEPTTVELAVGEEPATVELAVDEEPATAELAVDEEPATAELSAAEQPPPPAREDRRRGRGCLWSLVGLVLLLVGALVVADRVGIGHAEQLVAEQVTAELARNRVDSDLPEVTIHGSPFLTQVVRGRYHRVELRTERVRTPEIELSDVELVATGVTATIGTLLDGEGPIDAELLEGRATIAYDELVPMIGVEGLELSPGQDGALRIRLPVQLLGQRVWVAGEAEVRVTRDGRVDLRVLELELEEVNGLPPVADAWLIQLLGQVPLDTQLPPLPYDLVVDSVSAQPDGIVVMVSATDVPLAR